MDIHHLKAISTEDMHAMFVDSSHRDLLQFPTPSEYDVNLTNHIENVVGLDVLDATIPNTNYTVDESTNFLSFGLVGKRGPGTGGLSDLEALQLVSNVHPRVFKDTSVKRFRVKMLQKGEQAFTAGTQTPVDFVVSHQEAEILEVNPARVASLTDGTSSPVFLGGPFPMSLLDPMAAKRTGVRLYLDGDKLMWTDSVVTRQALVTGDGYVIASFIDSRGARRFVEILVDSALELDLAFHVAISDGKIETVRVVGVTGVELGTHAIYSQELVFLKGHIPIGDHRHENIVNFLAEIFPTVGEVNPSAAGDVLAFPMLMAKSLNGSSPTDFTRDRRLEIVGREFFWIDSEVSTISNILGFSLLTRDSPVGYSVPVSLRVFGSVKKGDNDYRIVAPGIMDLTGERFVVLRCPQIEENTNNTLRSDPNTAGIGIFKLYDASVAHLRFDFTNLKRRDMHPISRLTRLTLRFENSHGHLYDFKGVNHHLFVSIRYLRPKNKLSLVEPERSLNPDYDPDVIRYMSKLATSDLDESDTEDDEEMLRNRTRRLQFVRRRRF